MTEELEDNLSSGGAKIKEIIANIDVSNFDTSPYTDPNVIRP